MARINLLPWREDQRKRRRRELGIAAASALTVTLLLGVLVHLQIEHLIDNQLARNAYLNQEITQLNLKIKEIKNLEETKSRLLARMNIIQQLQQSRPEVVHLFDELVVTIPEGVALQRVEQKSDATVVVDGTAQSNARVSAFMRNIDASPWIGNPHLRKIEHKDQGGAGLSLFELQFQQRHPTKNAGDGEAPS